MYTRLIILSVIILAAFCGLGWLGYHAVETWAEGLEGARLGEFAAVAEQIRQDVKRRLDEFIQTEQDRPYTDYQYYYVPENIAPGQQEMPLVRSPLAFQLENDLAYGNFQIDSDGMIVTPYYREEAQQGPSDQPSQKNELAQKIELHLSNIGQNVVPLLNITAGKFNLPSTDDRLGYERKQASLARLLPFLRLSMDRELVAQKMDSCRFLLTSKVTKSERSPLCFLCHRQQSHFS